MQARQLIGEATYGPQVLKVLYQAFDEAWAEIAPRYGDDRAAIEAARLRLASILLSLASEDSHDVAQLKNAALMRFNY